MPGRDRGRREGKEALPVVETLDRRVLLSAAPDFVIKVPAHAVYSQQSGSIPVTVTRRDRRGTAEAEVTTAVNGTSTGTATPGVQYQPIDQLVTFRRGQSSQTVEIPVIVGAPNPGQVTLGVSVKGESASSTWHSATLTLSGEADSTRPKVTGGAFVTIHGAIHGVRLSFSEAMNSAQVEQVANYSVVSKTSNGGLSGLLGGLGTALSAPNLGNSQATSTSGSVAVKSVTYDPVSQTAVLTFSKGLKTNVELQVSGRYLGARGSQTPPTDLQGNPLENFTFTIDNKASIRLNSTARAAVRAKHSQ